MNKITKERPVFDLLEESFNLLRNAPALAYAWYLAGSASFVIALLFFWFDVSRNAFAEVRMPFQAFGLAILFIWMKYTHCRFMEILRSSLTGIPSQRKKFFQHVKIIINQGLLHATGLFLIPIALVLMIPFGWVFAYYQNTSYHGTQESTLSKIHLRAKQTCRIWPRQNHYLIYLINPLMLVLVVFFTMSVLPLVEIFSITLTAGISFLAFLFVILLSPLSVLIGLNYMLLLLIIPELLRLLFGIETQISQAGNNLFNGFTLLMVTGLTWLTLDPFQKAAYTLRCFYGEALKSGEDIRVVFHQWCRIKLFLLFFLGALFIPVIAMANSSESTQIYKPETSAIQSETLHQQIEEELQKPEYAWRFPRITRKEESVGLLERSLDKINKWLAEKIGKMFDIIQDFFTWLNPYPSPSKNKMNGLPDISTIFKILLYLMVFLLITSALVMLYKTYARSRKILTPSQQSVQPGTPDLSEENVPPDALPSDEWLDLAAELATRGEYRLALRACFLSGVSFLGKINRIQIARYKSNREYLYELRRYTQDPSGHLENFTWAMRQFERSWYGTHHVEIKLYQQYREMIQRLQSS